MKGKLIGGLIIISLLVLSIFSVRSENEVSAKSSDFIIENGILKQYTGSDKGVIIPKGVRVIGIEAFKGKNIEKVSIPDGVEEIDNKAFEDCISLMEVSLPDGVVNLGFDTFKNCSSLEMIDIPESVKYIGGG